MELPELESLPQTMTWKQGNIPVVYESFGVDISMTENWPSYVTCKPQVGDLVESTMGRQLIVKTVIHTIENNIAVLKIQLGKDTGGQHKELGGGDSSEADW